MEQNLEKKLNHSFPRMTTEKIPHSYETKDTERELRVPGAQDNLRFS